MKVRKYVAGEEQVLWGLFHNTIRNINVRDYTAVQIEAWAPDEYDHQKWASKITSINPFVVEHKGVTIGYADLQSTGLIDHFFVHHKHQRKGVGARLMAAIMADAHSRSIAELRAHVSITAKPFFEAYGFQVKEVRQLQIRGQTLTNFTMRSNLPVTDATLVPVEREPGNPKGA